ncbi:hypothetical protein [Burkholderia sp. Ac-20349]|uniref:hypothetical protein n=1 Tax=Burkholderia sp. Ac-20349 TaxID=2703893 RepID=UPI00197B9500|nr:hypothetical protein [Burkholderia sp. Ac-20349]MBN3841819.1 hypothetical protein [Burkholderia sp. Ac-20349]
MSGGGQQVGEDVLSIGADDSRIRTQAGKREQGVIRSTGISGMLMYGPYVALDAGCYSITIIGSLLGGGDDGLEIEVTSECGDTYLASKRVCDQEGDDYIAELSFAAEKPCRDVEIRVFVDVATDACISGIAIKRTGDTQTSDRIRRRIFDNGSTIADLTSIGSDTLVITFQPYGVPGAERRGFGEDIIPALGCDVLCFKPLINNWYQDIAVADLNDVAKSVIHAYKRRIGYGSSMGAYALFYFANALRLQEIVALSPQYSVDPLIAPSENRWDELRTIVFRHKWTEGGNMKAHVFYDPFDKLDRWHFQCLREIFPTGQDFALPFSGHPTTTALVESRQLKQFITEFIAGKVISPVELKRKVKEMSYTYAKLMILRAANRDGLLSVRLFAFFAKRLATHPQWVIDTLVSLAEQFAYSGKTLQAYMLVVAYVSMNVTGLDSARLGEVDYVRGLLPDQIREKFDLWLSGWKQSFLMSNERIQTQVGIKNGDIIASSAKAGALVYGPYVNVPAGMFFVTISGKSEKCEGVLIRITRDFGKFELVAHSMAQNRGQFSLVFECYSAIDLTAVEVIVLVRGESEMSIDSIDVVVSEIKSSELDDFVLNLVVG